MNVLVTGATSQIGVFLLARLQAAGARVYALSRGARADAEGVNWLQADLHALPAQLPACDALIHCAGLPLLPALLEHSALAETDRVIVFGSTSRFTKQASDDPRERALAAELAAAEDKVVELCAARGTAWTIFRPTLVYGCGRDKNVSFIAGFVRRFGFFPLLGAGRGLRQPVHADDLALACVQALACPSAYNRSYNLSGGETLSYRDMVVAICTATGRPPRFVTVPSSLLHTGLHILRALPRFRHLSSSMLERMERDLCFEHSAAARDFGYAPRTFRGTALGLGDGA